MLVSTFELLVKPIAPSQPNIPDAVARTVVQGYFLTVANPNDFNVDLKLQFTATTPGLNIADTVTILDVTNVNGNEFGEIKPVFNNPKKFTYDFKLPAFDTALVTLLPDLKAPGFLQDNNQDGKKDRTLEIRGYVEISLLSPFSLTEGVKVLLTPEHRGTFLPNNSNAAVTDFDQLAYALPTATGSSLFTVRSGLQLLPKSDSSDESPAVGEPVVNNQA